MIDFTKLYSLLSTPIVISQRLFKGVILAAWIGLLVWLAGLAASGKASQSILELFRPSPYDYLDSDTSQNQLLAAYLSKYDDDSRPPIEAILDLIIKNPSWNERDISLQFPEQRPNEKNDNYSYENRRSRWVREHSFALFGRVDSILKSIVSDKSADPKELSISIPEIPAVYKVNISKQPASINLPRSVAAWVADQRLRDEATKQRNSLIDTFFILIVLGAFGSLIFLTKDYIQDDVKTNLAAYFFRPILGIFLSVAIFVIDMVAHSVISTADILKMRHETLFVLALAAGLLSEQAYAIVSYRAQNALNKLKEKSDDSMKKE